MSVGIRIEIEFSQDEYKRDSSKANFAYDSHTLSFHDHMYDIPSQYLTGLIHQKQDVVDDNFNSSDQIIVS